MFSRPCLHSNDINSKQTFSYGVMVSKTDVFSLDNFFTLFPIVWMVLSVSDIFQISQKLSWKIAFMLFFLKISYTTYIMFGKSFFQIASCFFSRTDVKKNQTSLEQSSIFTCFFNLSLQLGPLGILGYMGQFTIFL